MKTVVDVERYARSAKLTFISYVRNVNVLRVSVAVTFPMLYNDARAYSGYPL